MCHNSVPGGPINFILVGCIVITCLRTSCTTFTLSLVEYSTLCTSWYSISECSSIPTSLESFEPRSASELTVDMVLALLPGTGGSPSDTVCSPISTSPVDGSAATLKSSFAGLRNELQKKSQHVRSFHSYTWWSKKWPAMLFCQNFYNRWHFFSQILHTHVLKDTHCWPFLVFYF